MVELAEKPVQIIIVDTPFLHAVIFFVLIIVISVNSLQCTVPI